jgi:hypothetical protein
MGQESFDLVTCVVSNIKTRNFSIESNTGSSRAFSLWIIISISFQQEPVTWSNGYDFSFTIKSELLQGYREGSRFDPGRDYFFLF